MNILIIHNYYQQRGGEDAVFENESKELEKQGHNVIRYIRNNSEIDNYSFFKKIKFLFSILNNRKTIKDIKNIINKNKIDIAHVHNIFPLISTSVYKILKENNIKIIQTIHNYRFLCINAFFYRKNNICTLCAKGNFFYGILFRCFKKSFFLSVIYSLMVMTNQNKFRKYIDGYISLTEFTKNIFVKYGYKKEKIYIKDNGFIDNKIRRAKSGGYFLFLGRISIEKGIFFLLDFFKEFKQYKLVIAGSSENIEEYKNEYNCPNIIFKGFVDGEKKSKLIQEAHALILPSLWYENYPVTVTESFCCGIPVIGSNIGGIPFIIKDKENGFLFEKNKNSLKEKLDIILKNSHVRETLGDRARETYSNKMEMSHNIQKLVEIYKDVINGK